MTERNPFLSTEKRPHSPDDRFSRDELRLANRNHGAMLELLKCDVTPAGGHYLLNHFDVPVIDASEHQLRLHGAFQNPMTLSLADLQSREHVTIPVTLECAGNGRAGVTPRSSSMPWMYEAVGTSEWTGTPLRDVLQEALPNKDVQEISFTGADYGFDGGVPHHFGRSLTLEQIADLDVLLVWAMNGAPLLPQHGAPLRIVVPGWYGMASVKWLTDIEALTRPYEGYQQIHTYKLRQDADDPGRPIGPLRVKSLMVPPGVPDWFTRKRYLEPGRVKIMGRAWSGGGVGINKVEFGVGEDWFGADVEKGSGPYAWSKWTAIWDATPGTHRLRCRATDVEGKSQPLDFVWDQSGFANNAAHVVEVFVPEK